MEDVRFELKSINPTLNNIFLGSGGFLQFGFEGAF